MDKKQIFEIINKNPVIYLATVDGNEPRVRAMALYKADGNGIIFHSGPFKDVYRQIQKNANVQMCFYDGEQNIQIRVRGKLEMTDDIKLKEEISNHPSRGFMQAWKAGKTLDEFYKMFSVFVLKKGRANVWTFQTNFLPKEDIEL